MVDIQTTILRNNEIIHLCVERPRKVSFCWKYWASLVVLHCIIPASLKINPKPNYYKANSWKIWESIVNTFCALSWREVVFPTSNQFVSFEINMLGKTFFFQTWQVYFSNLLSKWWRWQTQTHLSKTNHVGWVVLCGLYTVQNCCSVSNFTMHHDSSSDNH